MSEDLRQRLKQAYELHRAGQAGAARAQYRAIIEREPQQAEANNLMGLLCIQTGEPVKATRYIRRAIRRDPVNPQSHYNLGIAYKDLGRMQEATKAFGEAVRLDDENPDYRSAWGNALRLSGNPRAAVDVLEEALRKAAGSRELRLNLSLAQNDLGAALVRAGNPGRSLDHFLRAVELNPGHARAHFNLGLTMEQLGRLEEATRHYQQAIGARPDFADAHFQLAHLRTRSSSREEIDAMQRLLARPDVAPEDRVRLAFGLGFALESNRRYAEAFSYMLRAHELQGANQPFDLAFETRRFERIRQVFGRQRVAAPEATGPKTPDVPVLICGMPRSGTTLAEQVLASHPEVHGNGESMALARAARMLAGDRRYPDGLKRLDAESLGAAAEQYLGSLRNAAGGKTFITDTTPMNFLYVGLASMLLPNARFVLCSRDPLDNCLSIFRQMLTGANAFAHKLEDLGDYYRLQQGLLEHWMRALGNRVLRLQYEDMVHDNERQVRRLLAFCGLPFDPRCLKFHESERPVRSPTAAQVRQPIYDSSIGFWKHYENQLEPLRKHLRVDP
jgi:tetratricopeptide (TPR) repeat protein